MPLQYRDATEDNEPPAHDPPVWLRKDEDGTVERTSDPSRDPSHTRSDAASAIGYIGATGQDNALAIVEGVEAWKVLTNGKGPLWRKFNRKEMGRRLSQQSKEDGTPGKDPLPPGHSQEDQENPEMVDCPFTAMANLGRQADHTTERNHREGSSHTPPRTQEHYVERQSYRKSGQTNATSPPPSVSGSASKCPIRMLDERSPEEVARYFETHKHEIPRSHEVCVKRYQSNAQSIRQLDAKYGNFVSMIQGLGTKHQPLLPAQDRARSVAEMDTKSAEKVENWADNVEDMPADVRALHRRLLPDADERQGHFDRALKEIRVGESPSRPWGIPVPARSSKCQDEDEAIGVLRNAGAKVGRGPSHAQSQLKQDTSEGCVSQHKDDKPGMVFTGPVFIGYSADQAAALIEQCGWDPNGPTK